MGAYKRDPDVKYFAQYGQEFTVASVIVHPDYNQSTDSHDVALVQLDSNAVLNKYVSRSLFAPLFHEFVDDGSLLV